MSGALTTEEGLGGEVGVVGLSQGLGDVQELQAAQGVALQMWSAGRWQWQHISEPLAQQRAQIARRCCHLLVAGPGLAHLGQEAVQDGGNQVALHAVRLDHHIGGLLHSQQRGRRTHRRRMRRRSTAARPCALPSRGSLRC